MKMITKTYLKNNNYRNIEEFYTDLLTKENKEDYFPLMSQRQINQFEQFKPEEPVIIQDLRKSGYIPLIWHKNDIRFIAQRLGKSVDVNEVSDYLENNFDPEIGLNEKVIEEAILNQ
jgi:hypothetical protein